MRSNEKTRQLQVTYEITRTIAFDISLTLVTDMLMRMLKYHRAFTRYHSTISFNATLASVRCCWNMLSKLLMCHSYGHCFGHTFISVSHSMLTNTVVINIYIKDKWVQEQQLNWKSCKRAELWIWFLFNMSAEHSVLNVQQQYPKIQNQMFAVFTGIWSSQIPGYTISYS